MEEGYRDFPLSDILKIFHFCFEVNNFARLSLADRNSNFGYFYVLDAGATHL